MRLDLRLGTERPVQFWAWLCALAAFFLAWWPFVAQARAPDVARQVLAVYYGWYGNPATTGHWEHWQGVNAAGHRIANATHFPTLGAYDSHDPAVVAWQVATARAASITGFIASWWGVGSFPDQGMRLLLSEARKHGLVISVYYEKVDGRNAPERISSAVADLDYLLAQYGRDKAWLRAAGKPVIFVYARALHALSPGDWRTVIAQVRKNNPEGVALIADSFDPRFVSVFDGASTYNITGLTDYKTPEQIRAWAHAAYPLMVAAAEHNKIATVTIIPGYDDRETGRPGDRPVTERWGGEVYDVLWQEAIAARPDYVIITSWNEWHEGSELEPSVEYGSCILNKTPAFAQKFLAEGK